MWVSVTPVNGAERSFFLYCAIPVRHATLVLESWNLAHQVHVAIVSSPTLFCHHFEPLPSSYGHGVERPTGRGRAPFIVFPAHTAKHRN